MLYTLINTVFDKNIFAGEKISLPYPENKEPYLYYGSINHNLSFEGQFFKSPRDFQVVMLADRIHLHWTAERPIPAGAVVSIQLEESAGDFYRDTVTNQTMPNMVASRIFMLSLGAPMPAEEVILVRDADVTGEGEIEITEGEIHNPRTIVVQGNCTGCDFRVIGEDMHGRHLVEKIRGADGRAEGNKAFAKVNKIITTAACAGPVTVTVGNRFGLQVFLPGAGFCLQQLINGDAVTDGTIIAGDTSLSTEETGDARGLYAPPTNVTLDGMTFINLLVSLFNPGNIGAHDPQ